MAKTMKMKMSSEELRVAIDAMLRAKIIKQWELAEAIGYSATTLSQWLNQKYQRDTNALESALEDWLNAQNLSPRDRRKLVYITVLIESADNKEAIISTLRSGAPKKSHSQE